MRCNFRMFFKNIIAGAFQSWRSKMLKMDLKPMGSGKIATKSKKRRLDYSPENNPSKKRQKIDEAPQIRTPNVKKQREQCSICFAKMKNQQVGLLKPCGHYFCAKCIKQWSKHSNTCPIDRTPFNFIHVHKDANNWAPKKIIPVKNTKSNCHDDLCRSVRIGVFISEGGNPKDTIQREKDVYHFGSFSNAQSVAVA